jgi:hypothetical protein
MSETSKLNEIERRVLQSVYRDGLVEVFAGLFLMTFGTLFQVDPTLAGFAVLLVFIFNPALERVKQRWIYPRSGYVNPRQDPKEIRGIAIVAGLAVIVLMAILIVSITIQGVEAGRALFLDYIMPPLVSLLLAIGPWWMAQERHIRRGYLWSGMFIIIGFTTTIFQLRGGYDAVGLNCMLVGTAMLITGLLVFTNFIRRNPVQEANNAGR